MAIKKTEERGGKGNKSYREQSRGIPPIPGFTLLNGTANLKGRGGGEAFQDDSPCLNPRTVTNHPDDLYRLLPPDPSARPTLWGPCRANEMKFMQIAAQPTGPPALLYRGGDASNLYHEGETSYFLPFPAASGCNASNEAPDRIFSPSHSVRLNFIRISRRL